MVIALRGIEDLRAQNAKLQERLDRKKDQVRLLRAKLPGESAPER